MRPPAHPTPQPHSYRSTQTPNLSPAHARTRAMRLNTTSLPQLLAIKPLDPVAVDLLEHPAHDELVEDLARKRDADARTHSASGCGTGRQCDHNAHALEERGTDATRWVSVNRTRPHCYNELIPEHTGFPSPARPCTPPKHLAPPSSERCARACVHASRCAQRGLTLAAPFDVPQRTTPASARKSTQRYSPKRRARMCNCRTQWSRRRSSLIRASINPFGCSKLLWRREPKVLPSNSHANAARKPRSTSSAATVNTRKTPWPSRA